MRKAFNVAEGTTPTYILAEGGYPPSSITIRNLSDTTIYIQWTEEDDELTPANGLPIEQGETFVKDEFSNNYGGVKAIHGSTGNKEIRVVVE